MSITRFAPASQPYKVSDKDTAPPPPSAEVELLIQIRDLLKK